MINVILIERSEGSQALVQQHTLEILPSKGGQALRSE